MALLIIFLTTSHEPDNPALPALASSAAGAFQYPSIIVPDYPDTELKIPGFSSLSHVPTLNRFNTPAVSLEYPEDFCIYQQRGELSC